MSNAYGESRYLKKGFMDTDNIGGSYVCLFLAFLVFLLYVYANWYVQTFAGISIVVKGSVISLLLFFLVHVIFETHGSIQMGLVPKGVWINLLLVVYCLAVGPFVAYDFIEMVEALIIYAGYAVASMIICYLSSLWKSIDWFLKISIFTSLLCGIYALLFGQRYLGYGIQLSSKNNIHIFALVMFFGIFALAYRSKTNIWSFLIHFSLAIFMLYCIVESTSRKCLIAALIVIAIWLFSALSKYWKTGNSGTRIMIVVVLVCIGCGAFLIYNNYFLQSRTFARFEHFGDEESNSNRIEMYRMAFQIFLDKPVFGGGFHQYRFWRIGSNGQGYSHSVYAQSIADLGFVGTVLYFMPILAAGIRLFKLAVSKNGTYTSRVTFALYCAELFLGIGQIFFLEAQHMYIFTAIYWIEANETAQKMKRLEGGQDNYGKRNRYFI